MAKNWQSDWEKELWNTFEKSGWWSHLQALGSRSLDEFMGSIVNFVRNLIQKEREYWIKKEEATFQQARKARWDFCEQKGRQDAFKEVMDVIKKAQRFVPEIAVDMIQKEITKLSENK